MRLQLLLGLALLLASCRKDSDERYNQIINDTMECSYDAGWNVNALSDAIAGTYEWRYVRTYGFGEYSSDSDFKNWTLELIADSTFILHQADSVTVQGQWSLSNSWLSFMLDCQPPASTLWGEVLFCEPYLVFYSSPADGPDHLYERQ
ncbi:MAG: hypothetical protein ABWW61_00130 [Flavobacteriales bacterium]